MPDVVPPSHLSAASTVRDILATYRDAEDLVNIGAYVPGSNPRVDHALARIDQVRLFLRQGIYEQATFDDAQHAIMGLA
jgi:flagellar biosynthesis/type III secretory pathway ATPase